VQNVPGHHLFLTENMNGAKGRLGGENGSSTFVLTAFNFFC